MAKKRLTPLPPIFLGETAADSPSLTEEIILPSEKIIAPSAALDSEPKPPVQEEPESILPQRLRPLPAVPEIGVEEDAPTPQSRVVSLPNIPGIASGSPAQSQRSGFQVVAAPTINPAQRIADQRREEAEERSLFSKVLERPISGAITAFGALIDSENLSDIPDIMHGVLDETAFENKDRILEKGLKGLGIVFTMPTNAVIGAAGAENIFSVEALERGFKAARNNFADTFSADDYVMYKAMADDPNILKNPEKFAEMEREMSEGGYDRFVREIKEGRQVSDEKIITFATMSATAHVAEFVVGGGGITSSVNLLKGITVGTVKASLGTAKLIYKAPFKTVNATKTIINIVRGGKSVENLVTSIIKLNPAAVHLMKTSVSQSNLHSAKLAVIKTEISSMRAKLSNLKDGLEVDPRVVSELQKRIDDIVLKEKAAADTVESLDKEIIKMFGVDKKVLDEMLDFADTYVATAKQIRQNVKNVQGSAGKIAKQDLEEAGAVARQTAKDLKSLRKEQVIQFKKDFGVTPERVGQLREIWHDLLSVAKGRKDIKNISPLTQQLFIKGRGIKAGIKSDPVLIKVQLILQKLPPQQREAALKDLFVKTFKAKTGHTIGEIDDMAASVRKVAGENADISAQINNAVTDALSIATGKTSQIERLAIEQSVQLRGGLDRLRQQSMEKFGKDITQLSKKQIRELAKPLEKDIDELISVRDIIVGENKSEIEYMQFLFKKVFNVDLKNFDRADMMTRVKDFEKLKAATAKEGAKAASESGIVKRINKDFVDDYGITPQQFQQVEQLAADIHKTPWVDRFSSEFLDQLDYFATLTGGVKYRQFRQLLKAAPAEVAVPTTKFMKTSLLGDLTSTLRSHATRLKKIGGPAVKIAERISRRDEEARRMSGIWKEVVRKTVKGLNDDEIKAMRVAMQNDASVEKMLASISQFGSRIRPGVVVEAAGKTRDLLDEIFIIADDVGVNVAGFRKEYFPIVHKYSDMFTNERTRDAFVTRMMKEGVEMSQKEFDFLLASNQVNTGDVQALAKYASDFADLMADLTKRSSGTVRHTFQSREQAAKIMEGLGIARGSRASKNLTLSRHGDGLPGALKDPLETLNIYIDRAANTVNDQVFFTGAKGAKQDTQIRELIGQLLRDDHREEVSAIFNDVVNAPKPLLKQKTHRAAATIRALNTPKLAFMAINNSAQGFLGTLWVTDFRIASKAFLGAFRSEGQEFARRAGSVFENMEMQIASESGINSALSSTDRVKKWQQRFLKWNGATTTEIHNRTTASLGGKLQVEQIASNVRKGKPLTRKENRLIKELVFEKGDDFINNVKSGTYDANPEKWHHVLEIAGQRLARRSQLDPSGLFTREFLNSPLGGIWFQYKSFAMNHAKFMWQQTNPRRFIDEVMLEPNMTKFEKGVAFGEYMSKLLAYQVAGELVGDVRTGIINLWRDDKIKRPEGWERILQNFMYVGGLGIVSDIANVAVNGNKYQAYGQLLGPTGSDMATLWAGNMSEKASVVIEKLPIPVVNKSLADMVQGK